MKPLKNPAFGLFFKSQTTPRGDRRSMRVVGAAVGFGMIQYAAGAPFQWTGPGGTATTPTSGLFSTGFSPALGGTTTADSLVFSGTNTAYTATDDLSSITVNSITFNNLTNTGTTVTTATLARGAGNNLITLGGTNPFINFNNTAYAGVVDNLDHAFIADGFITKTAGQSAAGANPVMTGSLTLTNNVTIALADTSGDGAAELTLSGAITGSGTLTLDNATAQAGVGAPGVATPAFGTLLVSANNSGFSGAVNITKGRIVVNNDNALGSGVITVGGAVASGGVLSLGGNNGGGGANYGGLQGAATGITLTNAINLGGETSGNYGQGLINNGGINVISGAVNLTQAQVNVQVNNLSSLNLSNSVGETFVGASLVKSGNGTLILNNASFTGTASAVNAGNVIFTGTGPTAGTINIAAGGAVNAGGAGNSYATVQSVINSGRFSTSSAGTIAVTGANSESIDFTGYATLGLGATAAGANYSGALTAAGGNYRLGGGGGTLTVSGTNTLTGANSVQIINGNVILAGSNNFTGGVTLSNNTLTLGAAGALGTTGTINFAGGTLQFTAANTTDYSARFSSVGAQPKTIDTNGQNVTFATGFTGTGTFIKTGTGALTLGNGGTTAIGSGSFHIDGGSVVLTNGTTVTTTGFNSYGRLTGQTGILTTQGSATLTSTGDLNVSDNTGSNAIININGTGLVRGNTVYVGKSGNATGVVNITGGGTFASVGNDFRIGGGGASAPGDANAVGIINLSNGTLTSPGNFQVGASGRGQVNQTGGTAQVTGGFSSIGRYATGYGTYDLNGGNLNFTVTGNRFLVGETGTGVFNVRGGTFTNSSTNATTALTIGNDNVATSIGIVNLLGGTISTNSVGKVGAAATATFNFNGGTLQARSTNATYMTGLTNAYVYSGGAKIDTNNFAITIGQNLLAPTGNGLSGITFTPGTGTSYTAPPIVQITGGGGSGATAIANIDSNGNLTGFTITNPGTGYTSAPTVNLYNAAMVNGGTVAAGLTASIAANNTTPGGLTKTGLNTLTLTGASTYTGTTAVNQGTLQVTFGANTTARLSSSSALALGGVGLDGSSNGATLSVTGATATGSTQTFASTQLRVGASAITNTVGAAGIASNLALGGITHQLGGTVNFTLAATGNITTTNTNDAGGILGGYATTGGTTFANVTGGVIGSFSAYGTTYATATSSTVFDATTDGTFANTSIDALRFNTAATRVVTLNGAYSIASGGILETSTVAGNTVTISGGTSLTSGNGIDLIVNQLNSSSTLAINTAITGNIGLTKSGGGTLILAGSSDYTGVTAINNGVVNVNHATGLGTTAGNTVVASGAQVLVGNGLSVGESFVINGSGVGGVGPLAVAATTSATVTGGITLGSAGATGASARMGANQGGTLTVNGAVVNGSATGLDVSGAGGGSLVAPVGNVIGATTGLVVNAGNTAGTLVLGGANTYTGVTSIIRGNLVADGTGLTTGQSNINTVADINVAASGSTEASSLTVRNNGVVATTGNINLNTGSGSAGALNILSGTVAGVGNANGNLFIGNVNTANTSYLNVGGGTLDVSNMIASRQATATVNILQTGGTVSTRGYYTIGSNGASTETMTGGNLNVKTTTANGASLANGELEVGVFSGGSATFNQSGGAITLNNNANLVLGSQGGNTGNNTFNQNGGTVAFYSDSGSTLGGTGSLILGRNGVTGNQIYNLNGGTLTATTISRGTATGTGVFNFNGGTLKASGASATFMQGLTSANIQNGGGTIDSNGFAVTIAQALLNGGTGGLTKEGGGTLTLTATNTYAGGTIVNNGTLAVNAGGSAGGIRGTLTINSGAAVSLGATDALGFGAGTSVTQINVNGGTLNNAVAGNNGYAANWSLTGGTISSTGGGTMHIDAGSGLSITSNASATSSTISSKVSIRGANSTLAINVANGAAGQDLVMSGAISNSTNEAGANGITKSGAGTLVLGGTNTYSGLTTISGGTLALASTGSIDNTSGVYLGTNGTLDVTAKTGGYTVNNLTGSGTVLGNMVVSTTLAIGNSPGTVNFDDLTLGGASTYAYELVGGSNSADLANVANTLTITSGALLDLIQLGTYTNGDKFTLFAYSGALTGEFAGLADDTSFTDAGGLWQINYNDTTGGLNGGTGSSFVTITSVPEPQTWMPLISGLAVLGLVRRRNR